MMGSGAEVAHETVGWLSAQRREGGRAEGPPVPAVLDRRTSSTALPPTVQRIAVLDRTKEPGAVGEPLYLDVVPPLRGGRDDGAVLASSARAERRRRPLRAVARRSSRRRWSRRSSTSSTSQSRRKHFTVGIMDDVTHLSLPYDPDLDIEPDDVFARCVFFGLGADGTVGANKNSIKIIGEETDNFAQGYFVYDSKKSGAITISHLRFGPRPIRSSYLVRQAKFRRLPPVHVPGEVRRARDTPRRARCSCSTARIGADEVWDAAAPRGAGADHREEARSST